MKITTLSVTQASRLKRQQIPHMEYCELAMIKTMLYAMCTLKFRIEDYTIEILCLTFGFMDEMISCGTI
jgi:hypothetical protein